jgi:hypothetical protein
LEERGGTWDKVRREVFSCPPVRSEQNSPALFLVGQEVLLLGDERLEDVGARRDADGHVALVHHGQAVHPVLQHHPCRLGHVRFGSHAAQKTIQYTVSE